MRPSERAFFVEALKPYIRVGERVFDAGTAVIYEKSFGPNVDPSEHRWYLDCPSYFGSTETRQIGRVEQAPGWREGLKCWTAKSRRFTGKGWEERMLKEFLQLTELDRRTIIHWTERPVKKTCFCCGHVSTTLQLLPAEPT